MKPRSCIPTNVNGLILTLVITSFLFSACEKKGEVIPPLQLVTGTVSDSSFAGYGEVITYQTTTGATWRKTNNGPGTVTINGVFTAGDREGVITMEAVNHADSLDRLSILVVVSKHAAEFNGMKAGGYILSFRHADASNGSDLFNSPGEWWKSCDNTVARQLTVPTGYADADTIGQVLRLLQSMHIQFDTITTSEFCRCKQTATGFQLPGVPIVENPALTFYVYDEINRYPNTMALYASMPAKPANHIGVTHAGFTGNVPSPAYLNQLGWGDAAIFHLQPETASMPYTSNILLADWKALARR